jgi:uncharacterized protein (TIGR00725 family)
MTGPEEAVPPAGPQAGARSGASAGTSAGASLGARPMTLAVVGSGRCDRKTERVAEAVGTAVGRAGALLVCGGLGGVMEAACRGASRAGGLTVGILPGEDAAEANPWVRVAVPTGMGELRNGLVVRAADALVAVGGEYGTLSELALALKIGRPVVGVGTWTLVRPGGKADAGVHPAAGPDDAVALALSLAGRIRA